MIEIMILTKQSTNLIISFIGWYTDAHMHRWPSAQSNHPFIIHCL